MRISDLTRLALKNIKGIWAVLPALGFAVAAFCLCFAGAILTTVQQEKAQPYEIVVAAEENKGLSDADVFGILQIEDVLAATAVLEIPVTVKAGDYKAELTLTGMDAAYLEGSFAQGGAFPGETVMPYIVLNEAACKLFKSDTATNSWGYDESNDQPDDKLPDIDWLDTGFSVQAGEGAKAVTGKVCGILAPDEEQEQEEQSAAYISVASAKALLRENGQNAKYKSILARVKNIGYAESVSKGIADLGLAVSNATGELQAGWDVKQGEMAYLIIVSAFCIICAALLLAAYRTMRIQQQRSAFEALRWMGMKDRNMSRLFTLQAFIVSAFGTMIGIAVSLSLPSFLPPELKGTSSYTLSVPFIAAACSFILCILAGVIPSFAKTRQPSL